MTTNIKYKIDILAGSLLFIVACTVLWEASSLSEAAYDSLGSAFVPKLYCWLLILCSVLLVGTGIKKVLTQEKTTRTDTKEKTMSSHAKRPWLAVATAVILFIFVALWEVLGYRVGVILFMLSTSAMILKIEKKGFKLAHIITLLIITAIMSFGGHYIFTEILVVDLP